MYFTVSPYFSWIGPWMKGDEEAVHRLDVPVVRKATEVLSEQPIKFNSAENIFGSAIERDDIWNALTLTNSVSDQVMQNISGMAQAIQKIIKRQMSWYLEHDPIEQERDMAVSAP